MHKLDRKWGCLLGSLAVWRRYFLSLMAGTAPAAADAGAWGVAISNLIEVTQTRSVYGHVVLWANRQAEFVWRVGLAESHPASEKPAEAR